MERGKQEAKEEERAWKGRRMEEKMYEEIEGKREEKAWEEERREETRQMETGEDN